MPPVPINNMKLVAGVTSATLRKWERERVLPFCPERDAVGRRVYTDAQVEVIRQLVQRRHATKPKARKSRGAR